MCEGLTKFLARSVPGGAGLPVFRGRDEGLEVPGPPGLQSR
jgi:hypothetical protein